MFRICSQGGRTLYTQKTERGVLRHVELCRKPLCGVCYPGTAHEVTSLVHTLSRHEQRLRYFGTIKDIYQHERRILSSCWAILGVRTWEDDLVAALFLAGKQGDSTVEFAWVTHPDYRNLGLARELARRGVELCKQRCRGTTIVIETMPENLVMRRLARSLPGAVCGGDDQVTYSIPFRRKGFSECLVDLVCAVPRALYT